MKQRLTPWLRPSDIVVMDNLNFHKMLVVRRAIEAAGALPIYLPTPKLSSSDLHFSEIARKAKS